MPVDDHLVRSVREALAAIPAADAPDIYAISFFIYDEDDDPQNPPSPSATTPNPR